LGQGIAHTESRPAKPTILAPPSKSRVAVIGGAGALTTARERIVMRGFSEVLCAASVQLGAFFSGFCLQRLD
jgi:hypothetical protein